MPKFSFLIITLLSLLAKFNSQSSDKKYTEKELIDQIFYPDGSKLIESLEELNLIRNWIGDNPTLHLFYRATIHGDSVDRIFKLNNKRKPLLIIVKTKQGKKFGGFVSRSLDISQYNLYEGEITKKDETAFLFSFDTKQKYPTTDARNALVFDQNYYFSFGDGDLVIMDKFLSKKCPLLFPNNYGTGMANTGDLNNGKTDFEAVEIEGYIVMKTIK